MELGSSFQEVMRNCNFNKNKVAIAVSGGVDSIVLLHLVVTLVKKDRYCFPIVLTVDHALRAQSQKEVEFVVNYAKELGVKECFVLKWRKQENISNNIQSKAREARYRLLTQCCKSNKVNYLIVAHHKDDQAETLLLRLERGSGIDGLSSMKDKSFFNGICILRPLLNFSRSEIEKYAINYQLRWIEDESNQNLKYRRNLYRKLLKVNNSEKTLLVNRICLTALHMQRAKKALMYYTNLAFSSCVDIHDLGYIEIKFQEFLKLPEEIALRVLLYSMMAISSKHYKPRYNKVIIIFEKILQKVNNLNCTLYGCRIRKYEGSILIIREPSKIHEVSVVLPFNSPIEWDNRFSCTILGKYHGSVTIAPLKKTHKLPKFLKEYNCCSDVFYSLPIILKKEKILAYAHMSYDKENIYESKFQCITNSIVKQNLVNLINI